MMTALAIVATIIMGMIAVATATTGATKSTSSIPTATFAVLECAIDRWADIDIGCARLTELVRPRDLDPTLGPELPG